MIFNELSHYENKYKFSVTVIVVIIFQVFYDILLSLRVNTYSRISNSTLLQLTILYAYLLKLLRKDKLNLSSSNLSFMFSIFLKNRTTFSILSKITIMYYLKLFILRIFVNVYIVIFNLFSSLIQWYQILLDILDLFNLVHCRVSLNVVIK